MKFISKITIPYNSQTGHLYLNATAGNENEVSQMIVDGSLEIEEPELIECVEADLFSGADIPDHFFLVSVPFSKKTGEPALKGIGTNNKEAAINLDYHGLEASEYIFDQCGIEMPELNLLSVPRI